MSLPINMTFRGGNMGWIDTSRMFTVSSGHNLIDAPALEYSWKTFFHGNIPDNFFCKDLKVICSWLYNCKSITCAWSEKDGSGNNVQKSMTFTPYNSSTGTQITTIREFMSGILQLRLPDGRGLISYRQPGLTPTAQDRYVPHVIVQRREGFPDYSCDPNAWNIVLCPLYAIGSAGLYHLDLYETSFSGAISQIDYSLTQIKVHCPNSYQTGGRIWTWTREGW